MRAGSLLIREDAALPDNIARSREQFVPGWNLVKNADVVDTQRALDEANWHFFYAEPQIESSAYARDLTKGIKKAVRRLTRKIEAEQMNAVEITFLWVTKVFGLYNVAVTGHASHIQQSPTPPNPHLRERTHADASRGGDSRAA